MAIAGAGLILAFGCAGASRVESIHAGGMLGDYSALDRGPNAQVRRLQVGADADLRDFDRVMVDPVWILTRTDSDLAELSTMELQTLSAGLHQALVRHLRADYEVVNEAGPDVLRIRTALTEDAGLTADREVFAGGMPAGTEEERAARLAESAAAFLDRASVEFEVRNAATGERLIGIVGAGAGGQWSGEPVRSSSERDLLYGRWSEILRLQLQELKQGGLSTRPDLSDYRKRTDSGPADGNASGESGT